MDTDALESQDTIRELEAKIARLEKVNDALMSRVERSTDEGGGAFARFQNAIVLERKIRARTRDLEQLRTELERSNQQLTEAIHLANSAAAAKTAFLANMSHEIRTPLNGIMGILQLTLESELPSDIREDLCTVQKSANALLVLLDDILDISKIEAGKMRFEIVEFDLVQTVEDVAELMAEAAFSKGLELFTEIDSSIPQLVRGDSTRLRQVALNLVGNAIKFTESGHVALRVRRSASVTPEFLPIEFVIEDTGIGIEEGVQRNLFEPFTQADVSTTRKFGGSGLGLAISRQICDLLGGSIELHSRVGEGSTFCFSIGLRAAEPATESARARPELEGKRILVLDPHAGIGASVARDLEGAGAVCTLAADASAAMRLLQEARRSAPFDAALIGAGPNTIGPCVDFAMAARSESELRELAVLAGICGRNTKLLAQIKPFTAVDAIVTKPYRRSSLRDRLAQSLARAHVAEPISSDSRTTPAHVPKTRLRVLITEDTAMNQTVAKRMIERLGHEASVVDNGLAALEAVQNERFDIILMDCQMPVMDGYEATRAIRALESEARNTPILAMTADAMQGTRERCLGMGMNDYITKPVKMDDLAAMLERWL